MCIMSGRKIQFNLLKDTSHFGGCVGQAKQIIEDLLSDFIVTLQATIIAQYYYHPLPLDNNVETCKTSALVNFFCLTMSYV